MNKSEVVRLEKKYEKAVGERMDAQERERVAYQKYLAALQRSLCENPSLRTGSPT